jgi:CheY-like chemotaxis protein
VTLRGPAYAALRYALAPLCIGLAVLLHLSPVGANPGRFDAILTDERMPGVTGSAIIREVRRISPSIPILLMTGFVGSAAALKARELGATDVLKKPLLARELAASLARALQL